MILYVYSREGVCYCLLLIPKILTKSCCGSSFKTAKKRRRSSVTYTHTRFLNRDHRILLFARRRTHVHRFGVALAVARTAILSTTHNIYISVVIIMGLVSTCKSSSFKRWLVGCCSACFFSNDCKELTRGVDSYLLARALMA